MFEIFALICAPFLLDSPGQLASAGSCRDYLIPGRVNSAHEECKETLEETRLRVESLLPDAWRLRKLSCRPRPESPLTYEESAPGVFVHRGEVAIQNPENRGDIANTGFIVGENSVLAIDSGGSYYTGTSLYLAIRAVTELPIRYLVLSHAHPDHTFGATAFSLLDTKIIGHKNLQRAMAERFTTYLDGYAQTLGPAAIPIQSPPVIDIEVHDSGMILDLGARRVRLDIWPLAHSSTDLTVFDISSRSLFAGDLLFEAHVPVIDGSIRGWQRVVDRLRSLAADHVVPGHGGPWIPGRGAFGNQDRYFRNLIAQTKAAIAAGDRLGDVLYTLGQSERAQWHLFDEFNPRNVTVVFSELEWE